MRKKLFPGDPAWLCLCVFVILRQRCCWRRERGGCECVCVCARALEDVHACVCVCVWAVRTVWWLRVSTGAGLRGVSPQLIPVHLHSQLVVKVDNCLTDYWPKCYEMLLENRSNLKFSVTTVSKDFLTPLISVTCSHINMTPYSGDLGTHSWSLHCWCPIIQKERFFSPGSQDYKIVMHTLKPKSPKVNKYTALT